VREQVRVEPISETQYNHRVEAIAGKCRCGGRYLFNAPPRCPKCRSTDVEEGEITAMYD
jgi:predicted Zn-ribbon and HTH transcriptional regulator